ncbi:MAG TPA: ABC transporter ATP-binding protein [Terriglobales bacterium]|nr:ABC transporter ATP-binding protein [Terriglobales bacterium]
MPTEMLEQTQLAVDVHGLSRAFPGVQAVADLSFDVKYGEIFGLVGPDGAGKTTTMRMLAGVLAPDKGKAIVAGYDLAFQAEAVKHHISYMPQRFGLYEDLTVDENIRFYADIFGVKPQAREERALQLLEAADMHRFRKRLAGKLSGGMKQKLGLVCALIHTPKLILLDEPTNGVDPVSRRDFWKILYSLLGEGVAILTSTAYLDEAERCHRVALLDRGRLLFCDTPDSLKKHLHNSILMVQSDDPRGVRDALSSATGVSSAVLVGDGVHLLVDDARQQIPLVKRLLEDKSVPHSTIEEITPSIEDVFVWAVTSGQEAGR